MKASQKLERLSVTFDEPNLVSNAGLALPGLVARALGVEELIDERVDLSGRVGGANAGIKAMTVVSTLLAGGEWVDDVDVLRAGASEVACGHEVRAASTIGVWLRSFTWGHSRQLEAAAGEALARAWARGAGPRATEPVTLDLDSTHCETYGLGKAGGWKVNRDGVRGYHPQVAVVDGYDQVVATRLREGSAHDARDGAGFAVEAINRVRAAGAADSMTLRADAGWFSSEVVEACRAHDVGFSVTVRVNPRLRAAIEAIPEHAWQPIPAAEWAPNAGVAELAETTIPAFAGDDDYVRLVVRRVDHDADEPDGQPKLVPAWRYHAFVTDRYGWTTREADAWHRGHAQVENVVKDLKDHAGLAHLPSGVFAANAAWLTLVALAYNLGRWTLQAGKGIDCFASAKTLRRRLIAWPARLARHARDATLHAPTDWPWAHAVEAALTRLRALPAPT